MGQLCLLDNFELLSNPPNNKRVHYKVPTYRKYYKVMKVNEDTGEICHDSDEPHIFRIKDLQLIYSLIYGYCGVNPFERKEVIYTKGLTLWVEDKQAELQGLELESIAVRIKTHIKLLKMLREGKSIEECVELWLKGHLGMKLKKNICKG